MATIHGRATSGRDAIAAAATTSSVPTPSTGHSSARPRARATEMPARKPVNVPGPVATATSPKSPQAQPASAMISRSSGSNRSAWPRPMGSWRHARTTPSSPAAAEMARARRVEGEKSQRDGSGDRADLDHFRHVVLEQILDAVLQGHDRARAAGAGAAKMQVDDPALEALEHDVTTILRHRRPDPGLDQLLDLPDRGIVLRRCCRLRRAAHRRVLPDRRTDSAP